MKPFPQLEVRRSRYLLVWALLLCAAAAGAAAADRPPFTQVWPLLAGAGIPLLVLGVAQARVDRVEIDQAGRLRLRRAFRRTRTLDLASLASVALTRPMAWPKTTRSADLHLVDASGARASIELGCIWGRSEAQERALFAAIATGVRRSHPDGRDPELLRALADPRAIPGGLPRRRPLRGGR